jgi:NAD(P)-dependent dehydrogenase (short-subunit alcohol dehydrogenase family)
MSRTYVVTGAASGIGKATRELLLERGEKVIGADIRDADVIADLSTPEGRATLVEQVSELSGGSIDAVLAIAGLATPTAKTAAVNFFGTVATLEGLRPLLLTSSAPRAVAVTSMASLFPPDDALLAALLSGDEEDALVRAQALEAGGPDQGALIYGTTKRALALWIRRHAATDEWAGASIPLNGVAPGVVDTPMTADMIATPQQRDEIAAMVPMPLNGIFEPRAVAYLLAWLSSEENAHLCGQVVFVDGGSDVIIRKDSTW